MVKKNRRVGYSTKEGITIWHVISCKPQEEYKILDICNKHLSPNSLRKGFILTYDRMRRYEGRWHLERNILFPAHVFLESEDENLLADEIKACFCLQGIKLFTVARNEEIFLKKLCGESHNLNMSEGIIRRGIPKIIRGPLKGMESRICKIDRHKRLAKVETTIYSDEPESRIFPYLTAGLEITEKDVEICQ